MSEKRSFIRKIYGAAISFSIVCLIAVGMLFTGSGFAESYTITVDGSAKLGTVKHFWSKCVGTGTMEYCLKPAWQLAARMGVKEAGFEYVRGHGILLHGNNVDNIYVLSWAGSGTTPKFNWQRIDAIYDTVLACGLKPVVELSFMPKDLQTDGANSMPKDWDIWQELVTKLTAHLEERYGAEEVRSWFFEVWNEYDYPGFWKNTEADYYMLYRRAVEGIRSVDTNLVVGGPATTNPWPLQSFIDYCKGNSVACNFLSDHTYGGPGGDTALATNIQGDNRQRATTIKNSGKKLLSFNTEFNSCYSGQGGYETAANCVSMDSHKNAPFVAKAVKLIIDDYTSGNYTLPDILSYWALSDCFDESGVNNSGSYIEFNNGIPFAQVFGLINYQGIRKATFNEYRLLHMMGKTNLKVSGGSGANDGVDGFAMFKEDSNQVAVMIYDYYHNLSNTGGDDNVTLKLTNLPFESNKKLTIHHYRIDEKHSNPYDVWVQQGKKVSPSAAEWDSIRAHEKLEELEAESEVQFDGSTITKTFTMPRWSVSMLTLTADGPTAAGPSSAGKESPENRALILTGSLLKVPGLKGPVTVSIFSADGRLVRTLTTKQPKVDLGTGLSKGMYLVTAATGGMRLTKKMVVNR